MTTAPVCYFYTNILAPYMFHRWRMMAEEFPGSLVIVTRRSDPLRPWFYTSSEMDFPCISVPESVRLSNHLAWSSGLRQVIQMAADKRVVHILEDVSGLNALSILWRAKGQAFVFLSDGGFPERTKRPSQGLRWNLVGKHCSAAMAPGEMGKKYLQAWGFPAERIFNSYLSPDIATFAAYRDSERASTERNELRSALGLEAKDVLALCVSRLLDWKRLEDLAESLRHLARRTRERFVLLLIGDGPHTAPLQAFQASNDVRFKWLPAVLYEEMMRYYAASDFLVLPSEGDIWGLVVNEALSMGKPVVCTNRIGASELVRDGWNGFKVAPRSPHALAQAIENLVENEQLRRFMSSNALQIERTWHSGLFIEELKRIVRDTVVVKK